MFFSLNYPPISNTTNMFPRTINNRHVKQAQPLQRQQSQHLHPHLQQSQQITNSIQYITPRNNTTKRFNRGNMNIIFTARGRTCG